MIPDNLTHTIRPYEATNLAHKSYRQKFLWLNGSCYLLHMAKDQILSNLREQITVQERNIPAGTNYAVGIVTAAGMSSPTDQGTTWIKGIHVSRLELHQMSSDMPGFLQLVQRQTIIGAHRLLVDFCFDLLEDLITCRAVTLDAKLLGQIKERALSPKKLSNAFVNIGLPITDDAKIQKQIHLLAIVRNLLEHRDGKMDSDYIRVANQPGLVLGQLIPVESQQAGDALDTIDCVVNLLNQRATARWPKLIR